MGPHYHPGDVVFVRDDLVDGVRYKMDNEDRRLCMFVEPMARHLGKPVTIESYGEETNRYHIVEDITKWAWVDEMFAGLASDNSDWVFDPGEELFAD